MYGLKAAPFTTVAFSEGCKAVRGIPSSWLPWLLLTIVTVGCQQRDNYPANYREYAYISNGGSNTVTVLDLVNMRQDRVIAVVRSALP